MIYVFLADGFEEVEALAPIDILRRAGQDVRTVGVTGSTVRGSHGIPVVCDTTIDAVALSDKPEAVILPGGMPGTTNLEANAAVCGIVRDAFADGRLLCAICAAPSVPGHLGLLKGRRATCVPGFEQALLGAEATGESVCRDGGLITAKGAGVALEFGFAIVQALCGDAAADKLRDSMQCR